MANKPLTQRIIDTTPLPETGFKELRERGLVLRIFATGGKSWSFEYRSPLTGKNSRISFEAMALAEARAIVHRHRVALDEGKDPNQERKDAVHMRRAEHARAIGVADALVAYERAFVMSDKAASRRNRIKNLRRAVEPFNNRAVASLTKGELVRRLDDIQTGRGPVARNRSHAEMRAWLGWLCQRDHVPAVAIAGVKKSSEKARTRVLSDAELRGMLTGTDDGTPFSVIVRVLMHTGMRRGEAANLQPRDLDFVSRRITIRSEVAKTEERVIPMVEAIAPMLEARAEGLSRDGYIFGEGSGFASPFSGWGKPTDRLRDFLPEGEPWTLHDIRRTVGTRLHDAGVDPLIVEDLLGHISGVRRGVAGVYNRSVTLAKQGQALADWATKLAALSNVVALKRRVA
jgi:integrase